MLNQKNLILSISFLFYLLPAALITGPFFSDLIIVIMGIFFLINSFTNKLWFYYNNKFSKFFIVFYIYLIISSIWAEDTIQSLKSSVPYIRFLLFSLAIAYLSNVNKELYDKFFKFLFFTLFFVIIDAYIQFIFGTNLLNQSINFLIDSNTQLMTARISGLFGEELVLGSYLVRLIFILISLHFITEKKFNIFFSSILVVSTFILVFLSGERLAFFILLFCLAYIFIQLSKYRKKIFITFIVLFSVILVVVSTNQEIKNRMVNSTFSFLDNKTDKPYSNDENFVIFSPDHHELYIAAYKMFLAKPLLGHGHNMYEKNCENFKRSVSSCSTHPHNSLLQIISENGIIGLFFFVSIYFFLIKKFFTNLKISKKNSENKNFIFQICLLSVITANSFPLVPSGNFFNNWLSILYFLPIGLYLSKSISNDYKNA